MDKVYNMEELRKKLKRSERKAWFKDKFQDVRDWCYRNKDFLIFVTPTVIAGVSFVVKTATKHHKLKTEKDLKELYCYDRSLGHYWRLRRELSNREWVEIDKRKKNGERLADILSELKVLK